jgi:predicted GNAT family acetyltransferase
VRVSEVQVRAGADCYEITVEGVVAGHVEAYEDGGTVLLDHTEIDPAYGGRGLAGTLTQAVLDDVRARGLTVVPRCSYVQGWLDKHPEYGDLVQGADLRDRQA